MILSELWFLLLYGCLLFVFVWLVVLHVCVVVLLCAWSCLFCCCDFVYAGIVFTYVCLEFTCLLLCYTVLFLFTYLFACIIRLIWFVFVVYFCFECCGGLCLKCLIVVVHCTYGFGYTIIGVWFIVLVFDCFDLVFVCELYGLPTYLLVWCLAFVLIWLYLLDLLVVLLWDCGACLDVCCSDSSLC